MLGSEVEETQCTTSYKYREISIHLSHVPCRFSPLLAALADGMIESEILCSCVVLQRNENKIYELGSI